MQYWVESEDLWVANESGVVWRGRPDGRPAISAVLLPGTDDAAVILSKKGLFTFGLLDVWDDADEGDRKRFRAKLGAA